MLSYLLVTLPSSVFEIGWSSNQASKRCGTWMPADTWKNACLMAINWKNSESPVFYADKVHT